MTAEPNESEHDVEQTDITTQLEAPLGIGTPPVAAPVPPALALPSFVYALGRVEARFPSLAVEKEFAQVRGRGVAANQTDDQSLQTILSDAEYRYLARQLCWVFLIEGIETYILRPADPMDLNLLVEALRPEPRRDDLDCVIGIRGPVAPPDLCNGLTVPIVSIDQLYSFDRDSLIQSIPRPESFPKARESQFRQASGRLFDRILQMADNAGASDEHRALNYLAVRYPQIYTVGVEAQERNATLSGVEVRPSALGGPRTVLDVVFSYTSLDTDVVEKHLVRVDVTEEFPFLVTKLHPYIDR